MSVPQPIITQLLNLAPEIEQIISQGYRQLSGSITTQISQDIVTSVDHQVSDLLKNKILPNFPQLGLTSEESEDNVRSSNRLKLRIDPVDGSKHLAAGIPLFTSNLTLLDQNIIQFAMVINANNSDLYHAIRGQGAFKNHVSISVNSLKLEESFVMCEYPSSALLVRNKSIFNRYWRAVQILQQNSFRTRNIGIGGLSICLVASGASCAYVDFSGTTKLVDVESALFIAKEAKATVVNFHNQTVDPDNIGYNDKSQQYLTDSLIVGNINSMTEITNILKSTNGD